MVGSKMWIGFPLTRLYCGISNIHWSFRTIDIDMVLFDTLFEPVYLTNQMIAREQEQENKSERTKAIEQEQERENKRKREREVAANSIQSVLMSYRT